MGNCAVIFGGLGFVGIHYADVLQRSGKFSKIYLVDIHDESDIECGYRRKVFSGFSGVDVVVHDVRTPFLWIPDESVDLVINLAAVHREPGHGLSEYYETNLRGARHVTSWATLVNCHLILFTSSISPYGSSRDEVCEASLPWPETPYGGAKLAAELIHEAWAVSSQENSVLILRPGVIFGPSEMGNVSRMIRAIRGRYFFYAGNRSLPKAGIYIRELCDVMEFLLTQKASGGGQVRRVNVTMNPAPTIEEYACAIQKVFGYRSKIHDVPHRLLMLASKLLGPLISLKKPNHPFKTRRIEKLIIKNNVRPQYLIESGYQYKYTLQDAMFDWKNRFPDEWA